MITPMTFTSEYREAGGPSADNAAVSIAQEKSRTPAGSLRYACCVHRRTISNGKIEKMAGTPTLDEAEDEAPNAEPTLKPTSKGTSNTASSTPVVLPSIKRKLMVQSENTEKGRARARRSRSLERDEREHEARLAALRTSIDAGDRSGVAKGDVFRRVRKLFKLPGVSR
jgi:hypothetical protein